MNLRHFTLSEFDSPDLPGSGERMCKNFLRKLDKARKLAGFTMTSNANMYDISATSTNSVSAGDFLMLAFRGSLSSFYYFTITIYGDI